MRRTKLFFSYSNHTSEQDIDWRGLFLKHLKTLVSFEEGLWVDCHSIAAGANWNEQIGAAVAESKCALILLTPEYLKHGSFTNDTELPLLLKSEGLHLLPVLAEPCTWEDRADLAKLEIVPWRNNWLITRDGDGERRILRALSEAGIDETTHAAGLSDIERAVMEVCEYVRRAFGVGGQITQKQGDDLLQETRTALADQVALESDPVHMGDFAVVYRGTFNGQTVAVKALPTAAWRNRVDKAFQNALTAAFSLRDESFIRVHRLIVNPEVHGLVMEYINWDTLDKVVSGCPGRRLPPLVVARILERIASAQHEAHKSNVQIGALSPASIYVNQDWEVRLTPIRIEGHLARALTLSTAQVVNWDVLTMLAPEIYEGRQPVTANDLDALEQYYLGLLGLELLIGRRPVEVSCFKDLDLKAKFFDDPRACFEIGAEGQQNWTEECPSLAYLLARMLARAPAERLPSAEEMKEELRRVSEDALPNALRQSLEDDLCVVGGEAFAARFYDRLRKTRPLLEFHNQMSHALAENIRDLVVFRRGDSASRFHDHVESHRTKKICPADVEAFRHAFVAEVIDTLEQKQGHQSSRICGDAWNAALKLGLGEMARALTPRAKAAGAG